MTRPLNSPQRTEAQLAVIDQLRRSLSPFFRIRVTVTARSIHVFLLVAEKEGLSVSEYAKRADMPITTMSRTLLDMSERDSRFAEGDGLIESRDNPENRREKIYNLTVKGRALLGAIMKAIK